MCKKLAALTTAVCLSLSASVFAAQAPTGLHSPVLSTDQDSTWLTWERPAKEDDAVYYNIYADGKKVGTTQEPIQTAGTQAMQAFQQRNQKLCGDLIRYHSFEAKGLQPATSYRFTVRAVGKDGRESGDSQVLTIKTTAMPQVVKATDYGAVGDGKTVNTAALQKAIDATPTGGVLELPAGTYVAGALTLKSNMTLQLDKGAVLQSSLAPEDFPLTNGRYDSLLAARGIENLRIVGEGTLNGSGWQQAADGHYYKAQPKSREEDLQRYGLLAKNLTQKQLDEGWDFKKAYYSRNSIVVLRKIKNLYVEGVSIVNPAMHDVVVSDGDQVTFNNVRIVSYDSNNGDGIDFAGKHFTVLNSYFDCGDDDIAFSAGSGAKAAQRPSVSDIWIFNNFMKHGHGGIVLGSHTASWIERLLGEDNIFHQTEIAFRCKTSPGMMGGGRQCTFRHNIAKDMMRQAFLFTTQYKDTSSLNSFQGSQPGIFHDMLIEDCAVQGTGQEGLRVFGLPGAEHHDITLRNVRMLNTKPNQVVNGKNINYDNVTHK